MENEIEFHVIRLLIEKLDIRAVFTLAFMLISIFLLKYIAQIIKAIMEGWVAKEATNVRIAEEITQQERYRMLQAQANADTARYNAIRVLADNQGENANQLDGNIQLVNENPSSQPYAALSDNAITQSSSVNAQDVSYRETNEMRSASKIPWKGTAVVAVVAVATLSFVFALSYIFFLPFEDVSFGDTYFWAVRWAYRARITTGTDKTHFSPNDACNHEHVITFVQRAPAFPESEPAFFAFDTDDCTRGEFITYLWLVIEQPEDVWGSPYRYYGRAIQWAIDNKITSAASFEEFSPDKPCLRWHAVTFLYKARNLL